MYLVLEACVLFLTWFSAGLGIVVLCSRGSYMCEQREHESFMSSRCFAHALARHRDTFVRVHAVLGGWTCTPEDETTFQLDSAQDTLFILLILICIIC